MHSSLTEDFQAYSEKLRKPEVVLTDDEKLELIGIYRRISESQRDFRDPLVRKIKLNYRYLDGEQHLFWSSFHSDWLPISTGLQLLNLDLEIDTSDSLPDTVVNHFAVHTESIITALSNRPYATRFTPVDIANPRDVKASTYYGFLSDAFHRQDNTNAKLHFLFLTGWLEGALFCKLGYDQDSKYGTYQEGELQYLCPSCGISFQEELQNGCPMCGGVVISDSSQVQIIPKTKVRAKFYGPLEVSISPSAINTDPDSTEYLIHSIPRSSEKMLSMYPELRETGINGTFIGSSGGNSNVTFENLFQDFGNGLGQRYNQNTVVEENVYIDACQYESVVDKKLRDKLKREYPNGLHFILINDKILKVYHENWRDTWILSGFKLSKFMLGKPPSDIIVETQTAYNVIQGRMLDQLAHSDSLTFVDSGLVSTKDLQTQRARPGDMVNVNKIPGEPLNAGFYETKYSQITNEAIKFSEMMEQQMQFLSGSSPGIWGGSLQTGSSRTAAEYRMVTEAALQRLGLFGKMFADFFSRTSLKAVQMWIDVMLQDEMVPVKRRNSTKFKVVNIPLDDLKGEVRTELDPESSTSIPVTPAQQQIALFELLRFNNPEINSVLTAGANQTMIAKIMGFDSLVIPGQADRDKQQHEIDVFLEGGFVEVDIAIDDHQLHMEVVLEFLNSTEGIQLKETNIEIYNLIREHYLQHRQAELMEQSRELMEQSQLSLGQGQGQEQGEQNIGNENIPPDIN